MGQVSECPPCSCCRDWSKGSDMSQCEAALKDSPCFCRPHFLKQTAALARELCVRLCLLFSASSQPAAPSRRSADRGSPKARGGDAHHMAAHSQPPSMPGRGRGRVEGRPGRKREPSGSRSGQAGWRGRRRALAFALLRPQPWRARSLLLLLLLRRRLLGAVCSAPRGSRSPRNAHTLNRYIVDIRG